MWFVKLADYFDSSGRLVVGDSFFFFFFFVLHTIHVT